MLARRNHKKRLELFSLDVEKHYQEQYRYLANEDIPLDILLSLELAQIKTFAIPSISKILHRTGQYETEGVKRLDDTRAILTEILDEGVQAPRGHAMVEHLNWIHGHYDISNDDYLYTLILFIIEPSNWMKAFGYRCLTEQDKNASYYEFRALGEAMGITNIPESYDACCQWQDEYKKSHMKYAETNQQVTEGTLEALKYLVPWVARPFLKKAALVLINDDELLLALGMEPPSSLDKFLVGGAMKIRAFLMKYFNPWAAKPYEESHWYNNYPSYPNGYKSCPLGPSKILKNAPKGQGCPMSFGKEWH